MTKTEIEKILAMAGDEAAAELTVLYNAKVKALRAFETEPSAAAGKNLEHVSAMVERLAAGIRAKREAPVDPPFRNKMEVVKWLQGQGYKVKKSKLYKDGKNGLLRVQDDGSVRRRDVSDYILRAGLKRLEDPLGGVDELHAEKSKKEIEKLVLTNAKLTFELAQLRGKHLLKSDVWTEWAVKIGVFESEVKRLFKMRGVDWVAAVGGDVKKAAVFYDLACADFDDVLGVLGDLDEIGVVVSKM